MRAAPRLPVKTGKPSANVEEFFSHAISATCRAALRCNQNHPDYALDIFATLNCACACVSLVFFRVLRLPCRHLRNPFRRFSMTSQTHNQSSSQDNREGLPTKSDNLQETANPTTVVDDKSDGSSGDSEKPAEKYLLASLDKHPALKLVKDC
jgi:hypothetical protein